MEYDKTKYNNPNNPGSGYEPVTEPAFEVDGEKVAQAAGGALAIYCIYRAVKFVVAGGVTIATGGAAAPVMVPAALAP